MTGFVLIDKDRCNGCGLCVRACHEGALELIDGKAALTRRDFCDGMGDCLPACPMGAITIVEGNRSMDIGLMPIQSPMDVASDGPQWPIQLGLVPARSPRFSRDLVIAADCTAFSMDRLRDSVIGDRPLIIACPKLKDGGRQDKLDEIISANSIDRITVVRMEVPCCGRLASMVRQAAEKADRGIAVEELIVSKEGGFVRNGR